MRIIAIIINLMFLVALFFAVGGDMLAGKQVIRGKDWLLLILLFTAPISSLIALFGSKGNNWLSLYFRRKILETV